MRILIFCWITLLVSLYAQPESGTLAKDTPMGGKRPLDEVYLKQKKEGTVYMVLPVYFREPDRGNIFAFAGIFSQNGTKDDPSYYYAPYKRFFIAGGALSDRGLKLYYFLFDIPYLNNSLYRVRGELNYSRNPAENFFGVGRKTLGNLQDRNGVQYTNFRDYIAALDNPAGGLNDVFYNKFVFTRPIAALTVERDFWSGRLRPQLGISFEKAGVEFWDGRKIPDYNENAISPTRLFQEKDNLRGTNGGWHNTYRVGVVYDTRDFEPEPRRGVMHEIVLVRGASAMGSEFDYSRFTISPKFYMSPLQRRGETRVWYREVVFASRLVWNVVSGDPAFFNYSALSYTRGNTDAVGGRDTLRGYRSQRFVGAYTALANFELRWTVWQGKSGDSSYSVGVVLFNDYANVYDRWQRATFDRTRYTYGAGLRFAFNQTIIFALDQGFGSEGSESYFILNHQF